MQISINTKSVRDSAIYLMKYISTTCSPLLYLHIWKTVQVSPISYCGFAQSHAGATLLVTASVAGLPIALCACVGRLVRGTLHHAIQDTLEAM
jgi:hypothetical protein